MFSIESNQEKLRTSKALLANTCWVDGRVSQVRNAADTGALFSDGVMETMRISLHEGRPFIPLWQWHRERLLQSSQSLGFALSGSLIEAEISQVLEYILNVQPPYLFEGDCASSHLGQWIMRLSVIRDDDGCAQRLIQLRPFVSSSESLSLALSSKPLARSIKSGIKFLNRSFYKTVEREEKQQQDDVLLLNSAGDVIETMFCNVYVVMGERMFTPVISSYGVNGVFRRIMFDAYPDLAEKVITLSQILSADAVLISNAVHGVRWVKNIGATAYSAPSEWLDICLLAECAFKKTDKALCI